MKKAPTKNLEIDELARMTANGFANTATKEEVRAIREELNEVKLQMKSGFKLIMENLTPFRRDSEVLRYELEPQVANLEARLTKVERKIKL